MTAARTVIAALAAPLLSPAIQAISLYVRGVADANLAAKYFLTYLAVAAYLTPFMLGLPVHLVLWRLGWGRLRTYIVAGFLVGALTLPLIAIIPGSSFLFAYAKFSPVGFSVMMFFSGLTMLPVAVTFWLVARPDRYRRATAGKAIHP